MNDADKTREIMSQAKKQSPMRKALDELRENLPIYIEYHQSLARLKKAQYDALLKEGFTEKQAIEIVAKSGLA